MGDRSSSNSQCHHNGWLYLYVPVFTEPLLVTIARHYAVCCVPTTPPGRAHIQRLSAPQMQRVLVARLCCALLTPQQAERGLP